MKNIARASIMLGVAALIGVLFYFQPTAEAKTIFDISTDLQNNLQQQIIYQNNLQQQSIQQINQTTQQIDNSPQSEIQPNDESDSKENNVNAERALSFRATAYCLKGRTATGGSVQRGIVAADPRILPLGTRIQLNAGSYSGTYTVADTGGSVRGRVLDVWVPNCAEARRFGNKTVKVSVLGRRGKNNS